MAKPQLLLFPCNGNAREALEAAAYSHEVIGFVDDIRQGENVFGIPVYDRSAFDEYPEALVLALPGSSLNYKSRAKIIFGLGISETRWATIIHPSAIVSEFASVGRNCAILAGSVVMPLAQIGDHCCILANTVIHHDSTVGDFTIVASGVIVAGNSAVGENCYIGAGSRLINGIKIGSNSLVGIGATVISTFPNDSKLVGVPARSI